MQMVIGLIFASFHNPIIDKWDRDYYKEGKCVNHNGAKCEGDEYSDY